MATQLLPSNPASVGTESQKQQAVDEYFSASASYWHDIYVAESLLPVIYRDRHRAALAWVDAIELAPASRVLEIGCGAGLMTAALAQRGCLVEAIDSAAEMLEMTRREAEAAGVSARVAVSPGDAHGLQFSSGRFQLVVALGVIPWLHSPGQALEEMARVLRPGGYLIATADNRARLNRLLDPLSSPLLAPLRWTVKRVLIALGLRRGQAALDPKMHYAGQIDRLAASAGFEKRSSRTVGFGPFTLAGRGIVPARAQVKLHRRLQALADRGLPLLRSTGCHYMLLAQKQG